MRDSSPSLSLDAYAGKYTHPAHDEIELEVRDGRLTLQFPGALAGTLEHWEYDTFLFRQHGLAGFPWLATFVLDSRRRVVGLQLQGFAEFERL